EILGARHFDQVTRHCADQARTWNERCPIDPTATDVVSARIKHRRRSLSTRYCAPIPNQIDVGSVAIAWRGRCATSPADAGEKASLQSNDTRHLPAAQHICQDS